MNINRRSFLRTFIAAAALCVVPSFVPPATKRLLGIQSLFSSTPRIPWPGDKLTVTFTRIVDDAAVFECEGTFDCHKQTTVYGAAIGEFDDGTYEVLDLIEQQARVA